ncbi:MAG: sigma-54-dependent Fis family transcriptional regulator [Deltaproteobacteria bacterium]|nr:sigma-54-dependent Fis family transcriptional regulator [Deltaproteobacteria bacterium]
MAVPESEAKRVLVADDEMNMRRVLEAILRREGYDVVTAANGVEALAGMNRNIHTVITDLKMPGLDGMGLLRKLQTDYPEVPVVMITAHGSVENAVEAVKLGAFDYLEKPFEQEQIRQIVAKAMKTHELARRDARPEEPSGRGRFRLIGESAAIRQIYSVVEKVASTPSTVLITGESGTGKELIARALHENSSRFGGPFIKINCAAIPKTLMESELFGYEKGAFTGAVGAKPGRFELAHGGTLFLDEIGEIPVEMQVKLLRVLQESEFERVGGIKTIKVDVRLVTATNRDLIQLIAEDIFREDLFYRLNVVPIHIPPLRDRREDIPLLAEHFITKFNDRLRKEIKGISAQALSCLGTYNWPGNIRELENLMERTMLFCEGPQIEAYDLPPELGPPGSRGVASSITTTGSHTAPPPIEDAGSGPTSTSGVGWAVASPTTQTSLPAAASAPAGSLKEAVRAETERVERGLIMRALDETNGNVTQAARKLKISRKSLQTKMKEFGLRDRESPRDG